MVGALAVPHLAAGVAGVGEYRPHRVQHPPAPSPVGVAGGVGGGRAGNARVVEGAGDAGHAVSGQPLGEYPRYDGPALGVDGQGLRAHAAAGEGPVRVRAGVHQPVSVGRAAAEVAALVPGLDRHRGPGADPGASDLPFGEDAQEDHQFLLPGHLGVDGTAQFRHPHLDPVVLEQRGHGGELVAVEGSLTRADHHRIELPLRIRHRHQERGSLWPARPGDGATATGVEELCDDPPVTRHQRLRAHQLPGPGRCRVLVVLRGHPAVEREPKACRWGTRRPAAGILASPVRQQP